MAQIPNSINRRQLLTLAAATGAAALASPVMAQTTAPAAPAAPAPASDTTPEGLALVQAAYASVGHPLPADQVAEVRKQLAGYPGDFAKARKYRLENANAPTWGVTPPLPPTK